jgi:WD40 repeat protein
MEKNIKESMNVVNTVGFSPDGKRLISASYDGMRIWDLENDKEEAN